MLQEAQRKGRRTIKELQFENKGNITQCKYFFPTTAIERRGENVLKGKGKVDRNAREIEFQICGNFQDSTGRGTGPAIPI